jgi:hypothetical protein
MDTASMGLALSCFQTEVSNTERETDRLILYQQAVSNKSSRLLCKYNIKDNSHTCDEEHPYSETCKRQTRCKIHKDILHPI